MLTFDDLRAAWQANPTLERFVAAHPEPALLLQLPRPAPAAPDMERDLRATQSGQSAGRLFASDFQPSHCAWLIKAGRNPFPNLITVGRAPDNDVRLSFDTVSKVHAIFSRIGDEWSVSQRSAKSGLLVNLKRVSPGESVPLADGATIHFGSEIRGRFHSPEGLFAYLKAFGFI